MREILFATGNQAKIDQLRYVADHLSFDQTIIPARQRYGEAAKYEAIGETAARIALNGALSVSKRIGEAVVTEDTCFYVSALGGYPGVRAGKALNEQGREGLLKALEASPSEDRSAIVISAIALSLPNGYGRLFTHEVYGIISQKEIYESHPHWVSPSLDSPLGGGYNAVFIPRGHDKTLAQLSPEEGIWHGYREPPFAALLSFLSRGSWEKELLRLPNY
jgi:XTP/dITP diphosphohydrolase